MSSWRIPLALFLLFEHILAHSIDPNGYITYCPCMGRFGNQVEHFLGSFGFARALNRTLILPPFVEYPAGSPKAEMVDFDSLFDIATLRQFHRVIPMAVFMKELANEIWPAAKRKVLCWQPRESFYDKNEAKGCHAKEGNPFGPFWDHSHIEFTGDLYYGHLGHDISTAKQIKEWTDKFPPSKHRVLAFSSAPASFPVSKESRYLQKYLEWKPRILDKAIRFIKEYLPRPFIGIHLRNNLDWDNVCEHVKDGQSRQLFGSAQCIGYESELGTLTKEACKPSKETVLSEVETAVLSLQARSVFVASDRDYMIEELNERLRYKNVTAHRLEPDNAHVSLAILGKSDHFIGNCVSTFTAFVTRHREFHSRLFKSTTFFAFTPIRPKIEL